MDRLMNSIPGRVVQKFLEDQAPNWAALIAWNTLFAMFPMVLFAAAILGFVLSVFGHANDKVFTIIFSVIPDPKQQQELVTVVSKVKTESGILFIVSLLFMLWGGSALFGIMEQAFAVIYHTKPRDFIPQKLVSFAMVLLFTVLVGIALIGSTIVGTLNSIRQIPDLPRFLYSDGSAVLDIAVGTIAGFVLFLAIYYVIPNRKQQFHKVLPGAIVAAVLFEVTSLLFPLYLAIDQGIGQYGATFALLFILMTFFLLIGMITMVGVEVNSVLYPHDKDQAARGQWVPTAPETSGVARPQGASAARTASPNGATGAVKTRIRTRTAVLMAVGASVIGLLVGRRSAGAD